jgi:cyclic beta-1,2-glucan synthetase
MAGMEDLASQLAENHTISHHARRRPSLLDHLQDAEELLRYAYRYYARVSEAQGAISYASEWLLDNYHVVQRALRQIREDMPAGYYRQLPKLGRQSPQPDGQLGTVRATLISIA